MKTLVLVFTLFISFTAKASFLENWIRYPPSLGIVSLLHQHFPTAKGHTAPDCMRLTPANRGFLGASEPIDGRPMNQEPAVAFQLWYLDCLVKLSTEEATAIEYISTYNSQIRASTSVRKDFVKASKSFRSFAGNQATSLETLAISAEDQKKENDGSWFHRVAWLQVTDKDKGTIVRELLRMHLGPPESYAYLGLGRSQITLERSVLTGIQSVLADNSPENIEYLRNLSIDPKNPNLLGIVKLSKVLILSLDEFILE